MQAAPLVFDTGPLSHFATAGWLGVLKAVVGKRRAIIPGAVIAELKAGAQTDPKLQPILDAGWIEHHVLTTDAERQAFSRYSNTLVTRDRNVGEAAVLALAETLPAVAVIDDAAGRKAARNNDVALRPTLALLCDAIREGLLTLPLVGALADDLLATHYRLPFKPGGFERWATENDMFQDRPPTISL